MFDKHALIVGASGIVGGNLARHLLEEGSWAITGISRNPRRYPCAVKSVGLDVLDAKATAQALGQIRPTHVFFCTWTRMKTEAENCQINGAMVRNVLEAFVACGAPLKHVALVTGTKHYLGPFELYARNKPDTPFREDQPRLPGENFYYVQEDILFDYAARQGFSWSVHRPHTIVGYALGNAMNLGVTLACYATICAAADRPFIFPGSPTQYSCLTDVTDARLLARHLSWASTSAAAHNETFNVVNGDVFRWQRLWSAIAQYFDLEAAPYPGQTTPLQAQLADAGPVWDEIVAKNGLQPNDLDRLAPAWHTDADLSRPIECVNDMAKSRRLGFLDYQDSEWSFFDLFDQLRQERVIP